MPYDYFIHLPTHKNSYHVGRRRYLERLEFSREHLLEAFTWNDPCRNAILALFVDVTTDTELSRAHTKKLFQLVEAHPLTRAQALSYIRKNGYVVWHFHAGKPPWLVYLHWKLERQRFADMLEESLLSHVLLRIVFDPQPG